MKFLREYVRLMLEQSELDLSHLLQPPGPKESGKQKSDGVSIYRSGNSFRYVMYVKKEPVAALQITKRETSKGKWIGSIANVYTSPEHRRKGYAAALLDRAKKDFDSIKHSKDLTGAGSSWKSAMLRKESLTEAEEQSESLYHVTTASRLPAIAASGLGGGASQFSNYSGYSAGRTFLTEQDGVSFWAERVWQHTQHNMEDQRPGIPVVLRVHGLGDDDLEYDEVGSKDCRCDSFITDHVASENLEVWTGDGYEDISNWSGLDDIDDVLDGLESLYSLEYDEPEEDEEEPIAIVDYNLPGGY